MRTPKLSRRHLVASAFSLAALAAARPLHAAVGTTPRQGEGPFYPRRLPADADNDLVNVAGRPKRAAGDIAHVSGRVLDTNGRPLDGVRVEIWQCDAFGAYHHPRDSRGPADPNFQGYGQTMTGADGTYRFRTIRPVPYSGRAPHIHFKLSRNARHVLTTQLYVADGAGNDRDPLLRRVRDPHARARLVAPFRPAPEIESGALAATFDIALRA